MSYIVLRPDKSNAIYLSGVIVSDNGRAVVPMKEWEEFVKEVNKLDIKRARQERVRELDREKSNIGEI